MSETKKLTQEELQQILTFRTQFNEILLDIGQYQLRRQILEEEISKLTTKFKEIGDQETAFLNTLNEKYGDGQIDLETGEIK